MIACITVHEAKDDPRVKVFAQLKDGRYAFIVVDLSGGADLDEIIEAHLLPRLPWRDFVPHPARPIPSAPLHVPGFGGRI